MQIVHKRTSNSSLIVYLFCETANDYYQINNKMFTHSEYDTPWSDFLNVLEKEKEYFKHWGQENMVGNQTVIVSLTFINVKQHQELIAEIDKYFNEYSWENVYAITFCPIKDIKSL
jgi:hypothetical protein